MMATAAVAQGVIDVHSHIITPEFLSALEAEGRLLDEGFPLPAYDAEAHLKWMDEAGVETSVLTLAAPQPTSAKIVRRGDKLKVWIPVTNVGDRDGAETVFWYVADPYCSITRPVKELKHFEKQAIGKGETRVFTFDIDIERDFSFVDSNGCPLLEDGEFNIIVNDKVLKIELIK